MIHDPRLQYQLKVEEDLYERKCQKFAFLFFFSPLIKIVNVFLREGLRVREVNKGPWHCGWHHEINIRQPSLSVSGCKSWQILLKSYSHLNIVQINNNVIPQTLNYMSIWGFKNGTSTLALPSLVILGAHRDIVQKRPHPSIIFHSSSINYTPSSDRVLCRLDLVRTYLQFDMTQLWQGQLVHIAVIHLS